VLVAALALMLASVEPSAAQDTFFPDWEFGFRNDNDTLLDRDRYYSNGLKLTAIKTEGDRWTGWSIANETYTGAQITLTPDEIPPDDRPYAGLTYVSYFRGLLDEDDASVVWEFSAGCMGPCSRTERFQRYWHSHVVDAPEPLGWPLQIEEEISLQVKRLRQRPIRHWTGPDGSLVADLERTTAFRLGNIFTDATIGVLGRWRLGNMRGHYDGAGANELMPKRPIRRESSSAVGWADRRGGGWLASDEAFVFGRIQGSVVARNSTIEGELFSDKSPFTQDIRHAVIRTEIGVKFVWSRISFTASWNSTSTDFASRPWELNQHSWLSFYGVVH
jgi:hypothetical protein